MSNHILVFDRIKQISNSTGTSNFLLEDSVDGFGLFSSVLSDGDNFFYAITDSTSFEVGSGVYISSTDEFERHAISTSNGNSNNVDFPAGRKEVYITYPASHAVMTGPNASQQGGVAFWQSEQTLNYDPDLFWNNNTKYLGIRTLTPQYGIELGGDGSQQSMVSASGFAVGPTGLHFPALNGGDATYSGGIQFKHFEPNEIGDNNLNAVVELSGDVQNVIKLKEQNAGYFFAGPIVPEGCQTNCGSSLPSFRQLEETDLPPSVALIDFVLAVSGYLQSQINSNHP